MLSRGFVGEVADRGGRELDVEVAPIDQQARLQRGGARKGLYWDDAPGLEDARQRVHGEVERTAGERPSSSFT